MKVMKKAVKKVIKKEIKDQKILGIDDSGRGPVIGPLVMAGVMIPKNIEKKFRELGVKDSKQLSPDRRKYLEGIIKGNSEFSIIRVWPYEIDFGDHAGINLNKLEAIKAAQIINNLRPDVAILDCPSNNIPAWKAEVEKRLERKPKLMVEHKADVNHVTVSAASIIAKVARDEEIRKIQSTIPENIGSGYPSDPATKKFLEKNWDKYKGIFREKWQTWKRFKKGKAQKKIDEWF